MKSPPANAGDTRDVGSLPRLGRSSGAGIPWAEEPDGLWGHKELNTTER